MSYNKRILKTGALAVMATVAFAIFAFRAAEWSKGLNSEMIVLGQGSNGGGGAVTCPSGGTGTGNVQGTKIVPQMVLNSFDGGLTKYTTVIEIVNTSGAAQTINGNFYKEDGTPLNNVTLTAGAASVTTGVLATTSIPKDGILVIKGAGAATAGVIGWGKISYCGGMSISTFFELRDGRLDVLLSRVGVAASPANMQSFVVPRVREVATGLDVGFALVNTGSTAVNLTVDLIDAAGDKVPGGNATIAMPAGAHKQFFTRDILTGLNDGSERVYQYLKFSSTSPTFAAIALAIEGGTLTSFPVDMLQ